MKLKKKVSSQLYGKLRSMCSILFSHIGSHVHKVPLKI